MALNRHLTKTRTGLEPIVGLGRPEPAPRWLDVPVELGI